MERTFNLMQLSHRTKNIIIGALTGLVILLAAIVFKLSYGSYCTPLIKEAFPPSQSAAVK